MKLILALALAALSACAQVPTAPSADRTETGARDLQIEIRQTAAARWQVRYEIGTPVPLLYFAQQRNHFRAANWAPVGPDWVLDEVDGKEAIHRRDGKPFRSVAIDFGPNLTHFDDFYPFSLPFSDGSYALYSGHFLMHGVSRTTFRFVPLAGERFSVNGKNPETWESPSRIDIPGAFIYFGTIPTESGTVFTKLVDPGLEPRLASRLTRMLPGVFAFFEKETGVALGRNALVMVNRWPEPNEKYRYYGLATERWISLDLQGEKWDTPSAEADTKLFFAIAHELSHLYTTQTGADLAHIGWMNEGGADFFAKLLGKNFGLLSEVAYRTRISEGALSCFRDRVLNPAPLVHPKDGVDPGILYRCGQTAHAALARLLARAKPKSSFPAFWGELLKRTDGRLYDEKDYFAVARAIAPSADLDFLERFVTAPVTDAPGDAKRMRGILR